MIRNTLNHPFTSRQRRRNTEVKGFPKGYTCMLGSKRGQLDGITGKLRVRGTSGTRPPPRHDGGHDTREESGETVVKTGPRRRRNGRNSSRGRLASTVVGVGTDVGGGEVRGASGQWATEVTEPTATRPRRSKDTGFPSSLRVRPRRERYGPATISI